MGRSQVLSSYRELLRLIRRLPADKHGAALLEVRLMVVRTMGPFLLVGASFVRRSEHLYETSKCLFVCALGGFGRGAELVVHLRLAQPCANILA